jgi:hypothetical protein
VSGPFTVDDFDAVSALALAWPYGREVDATDDPWSDLLERSGRPRIS